MCVCVCDLFSFSAIKCIIFLSIHLKVKRDFTLNKTKQNNTTPLGILMKEVLLTFWNHLFFLFFKQTGKAETALPGRKYWSGTKFQVFSKKYSCG